MAEKVIHGPMWQFECEICNYMGDCWDTEREAAEEMQDHKCVDRLPSWAREEIERLRSALAIAAGMISTMPQYEHQHPESVLDMLLEEARRG